MSHPLRLTVAEREVLGQHGNALGDDALRRVDQSDRLLGKSPAVVEPQVLEGMLGVVAGVRLVRDKTR